MTTFSNRLKSLLPGYMWISSSILAFLFSLTPSPNLTSLHSAEWFWGSPDSFLWVYQDSDHPGHNALQGHHTWFWWKLLGDWLFWLTAFLGIALMCVLVSKRVWPGARPGIFFSTCVGISLILWWLYIKMHCENYFWVL
jgi:hypothetical protein